MNESLENKIENKEIGLEEIISEAKANVAKTIDALEALNIHVPERHNVLVPGTPTTPEKSESLLHEAVTEDGEVGIYLGVTVCPYICKFCRYYNRTGPMKDLEKMAADEVGDVIGEMEIVNKKLNLTSKPKASSVYIGGGTPTLMSSDSNEKLFQTLKQNYKIDADTEISMECTPDTLTEEKLKALKNFGVNRISMGVQRLDDEWLKSMNRRHSVQDVFDTLELLGGKGVNFNVDLIYGFEGQTIESFCEDLEKILKYSPTEITLYRFENQKRTDDRDIKVQRSERNTAYIMQEAGRIILTKAGYTEGPDGWFTKKGAKKATVYEDRWNKQIPLIGFGPEAYSYSKYQQHTNKPFRQYKEAISKKEMPLDKERIFEYQRTQKEIRRMVFELKSRFETSYDQSHESFFESLSTQGLGEIKNNEGNKIFKLSKHGIIAVEEIMRVLVEESEKISGTESAK